MNQMDFDMHLGKSHEPGANRKGHLKIFFGYAAGSGKTYAMLDDAVEQLRSGVDVVVGYINLHRPSETIKLLYKLPILPNKKIQHNENQWNEFDLDSALARKPELILIDELEHTNVNGVRNKKRYQDVEELLNAGIDVYTTIDVQHLESLKDVIQGITHLEVKETIPDYIFDNADKIKLIDIEPDELLYRFRMGKIVSLNETNAFNNYFTKENLRLLREIAMRKATNRISHDNQNEPQLSEKMANIKLLTCISSSPSSAKCIRWTARTADAFHAPWVVVYVDNEDSLLLKEEQKKTLQANIELAEQLGAEIVTLNGYDVAATVAQYARLSGITNIVIGKSRNKKTLKSFFDMDLEDKLISLLSNVEIYIIPNNNILNYYRKSKRIKLQRNIKFSWTDLLLTIGLLLGASVFSAILNRFDFNNQNVIIIYLLSLLIISRSTSGYVYGIVASVLSVLIYNFLFTEPYYNFSVIEKSDSLTFIIMLLVALITSTLTVSTKTKAVYAVDRERRTEVLYEINKKLLVTRGLDNIVKLTNEYIVKLFGRSTIFYIQDPQTGSTGTLLQAQDDPDASFMLSSGETTVVHWVFVNQKRAGAGTDTLMDARAFYMPVISQGNVLGVIGLSCANGTLLTQNNRSFLRMIASQVAMALERQHLSDKQSLMLVEAEKEKMRSNLLRAISHDLRTPLTGILGASSAILESNDTLDKQTENKLLTNIKEESQWLIRMVENLLSVTRINENEASVTKTPEAAEEIVAEAISRIKKRFKDRRINVKVPEELLFVPMDGTLIEQVIINLIENAIKHSGDNTDIDVVVKKEDKFAVFEVSDYGNGIAEQNFPYLFESYVPNGNKSSDSSRGMGIGLSICMSIVKAHQGKMEAENKKSGGAVFRFTLPIAGGMKDE